MTGARARSARTVGALIAALLALAASTSACSASGAGAATGRFAASTVMGQIQQRGYLRAGVPATLPPLAYRDRSGTVRGFDVGWARTLASALGVELRVIPMSAAGMRRGLRSGRLDIAFPVDPITEAAIKVQGRVFTDPYFVGHQRLVVPSRSKVRNVADLADRRVCSLVRPATEVRLTVLRRSIHTVPGHGVGNCLRLLRSGRVAAATGPEPDLLAIVARSAGLGTRLSTPPRNPAQLPLRIVGDQLSTEGYGVELPEQGSAQFQSYANGVFDNARRDGRWQRLFARWIEPFEHVPDNPPSLTAADAASLFPRKP